MGYALAGDLEGTGCFELCNGGAVCLVIRKYLCNFYTRARSDDRDIKRCIWCQYSIGSKAWRPNLQTGFRHLKCESRALQL
jgi:hypothetical protein